MRASSWTLSNRRSMTEGPPAAAASSIIATAASNVFRSSTPSTWPKLESNPPSATSTTLATTPSPNDQRSLHGGGDCCAVSRIDAAAGFVTSNML
jgi:hypothetical protein